jgi:hypothetical protein
LFWFQKSKWLKNAAEAAVRIETSATVYHAVAQTFQTLMATFIKCKKADTVSDWRCNRCESSQRMSEVGKNLTSESDAFDKALNLMKKHLFKDGDKSRDVGEPIGSYRIK